MKRENISGTQKAESEGTHWTGMVVRQGIGGDPFWNFLWKWDAIEEKGLSLRISLEHGKLCIRDYIQIS